MLHHTSSPAPLPSRTDPSGRQRLFAKRLLAEHLLLGAALLGGLLVVGTMAFQLMPAADTRGLAGLSEMESAPQDDRFEPVPTEAPREADTKAGSEARLREVVAGNVAIADSAVVDGNAVIAGNTPPRLPETSDTNQEASDPEAIARPVSPPTDAAATLAYWSGSPEVVRRLAWVLATGSDPRARDGRAAIVLAQPSKQMKPSAESLKTLAAAYAEVGQFDDALRAARRGIELATQSGDQNAVAEIREHLAAYQAGLPWREPNRAHLAFAAASDQTNAGFPLGLAHFVVGRDLMAEGRSAQGTSALFVAERTTEGFLPARLELAGALLASGRVALAAAYFEQALKTNAQDAVTLHNLGIALERLDRPREAAGRYRQAIAVAPQFLQAANNLAWLLATHERPEIRNGGEAVQIGERLAHGGEPSPEILDTLAAAYAEARRFTEACSTAGEAAQLARERGEPTLAKEIESRLDRYYATGRPFRGERSAHLELASRMLNQGDSQGAAKEFEKALAIKSDDAEALNNLGVALERNGQIRQAITCYFKAAKLKSEWLVPLNNLAWLLSTHPEKQFRDAATAINLAETMCKRENPELAYIDTLAAAYAEAGRFEDACRQLEAALRKSESRDADHPTRDAMRLRLDLYRAKSPFRNEHHAHVLLGQRSLDNGDPLAAVQHLQAAVASMPRDPNTLNNLAVANERLGRLEKAAECYRQALSLRPHWNTVANNLAWLLGSRSASLQRHADEAVQLAESIDLRTQGRNPVFLDTLAMVYASAGRFEEAGVAIDKALAILPEGQNELRSAMEQRKDLYQRGEPYREQPASAISPES